MLIPQAAFGLWKLNDIYLKKANKRQLHESVGGQCRLTIPFFCSTTHPMSKNLDFWKTFSVFCFQSPVTGCVIITCFHCSCKRVWKAQSYSALFSGHESDWYACDHLSASVILGFQHNYSSTHVEEPFHSSIRFRRRGWKRGGLHVWITMPASSFLLQRDPKLPKPCMVARS